MSRPVVALQIAGVAPSGVHLLVQSLASRCEFRAAATNPVAVLVVGQPGPGRADVRVALWCATVQDAASPLASRAVALLHDGALDELDRDPRVLRISPRVPGLSATCLGTAIRVRLRRARELPALALLTDDVADGWQWQGQPLAEELLDTALASAAVVVVTEPAALLRALSWGAPVVTCPAAAGQVGVSDGQQVLIGADAAARQVLAQELLSDELAAARLSRAGRRHIEQRYDLDRSLTRLALLLRLDAADQPVRRSATLLDSLSTPRDAAVRSRVALALHPLETLVLPDALSPAQTQALPVAGPHAAEADAAPAAPAGKATAGQTVRRIAKGVLRRLVGAGVAPVLAELRSNRAELARLQSEVATLHQAATSAASPQALVAELELLKAQVDALTARPTS